MSTVAYTYFALRRAIYPDSRFVWISMLLVLSWSSFAVVNSLSMSSASFNVEIQKRIPGILTGTAGNDTGQTYIPASQNFLAAATALRVVSYGRKKMGVGSAAMYWTSI